ncbi:MAG: hypothetical protein RR325_02400 [Bacilli bacterium]
MPANNSAHFANPALDLVDEEISAKLKAVAVATTAAKIQEIKTPIPLKPFDPNTDPFLKKIPIPITLPINTDSAEKKPIFFAVFLLIAILFPKIKKTLLGGFLILIYYIIFFSIIGKK